MVESSIENVADELDLPSINHVVTAERIQYIGLKRVNALSEY